MSDKFVCIDCGDVSEDEHAPCACEDDCTGHVETIAELRRERDTLRRFLDAEKDVCTRMGADNARRMQRLGVKYPNGVDSGIDALFAELERWRKYAQHADDCNVNGSWGPVFCSCGLEELESK